MKIFVGFRLFLCGFRYFQWRAFCWCLFVGFSEFLGILGGFVDSCGFSRVRSVFFASISVFDGFCLVWWFVVVSRRFSRFLYFFWRLGRLWWVLKRVFLGFQVISCCFMLGRCYLSVVFADWSRECYLRIFSRVLVRSDGFRCFFVGLLCGW